MGIVSVWLYHRDNPGKKVAVYALLDNASGSTFIKQETLRKLGVKGSDTRLQLTTMHGTREVETKAVEGLVAEHFQYDHISVRLPRTYERQQIPADRDEIPRPNQIGKWSHLKEVAERIPAYMENIEVAILIGLNCPSALRPRDVFHGNDEEPYAVKSLLGWHINGPVNQNTSKSVSCNRILVSMGSFGSQARACVTIQRDVKEIISPNAVKEMFEIEFAERERGKGLSQDDLKFLEKAKEGIHHCEDMHYEMPLPFKNDDVQLPNNRPAAEQRLRGLRKKLQNDEQYRTDYLSFMNEIIKKGYARKIDQREQPVKEGRVWYIPHHGVYHPHKPGKIRVVFDCSSRYLGESLNDHLLQGPDLTSKLIGVLTRFRQEKVAFTADIEQMFYQVKVREEDQDFLRFLWWPSGNLTMEPEEYCMTVHLFGAASSPDCANYALKRMADDNEDQLGTKAADTLRRNFYVDDSLKSTPTVDETVGLVKDVQEMCCKGGFNLTKFISNSVEVNQSIPLKDRAKNIKELELGQDRLPIERTLGVLWCVESDSLKFRIELKDVPCTRRGIREEDKWEKWRNELHLLEQLAVPRSFKPRDFRKVVSRQLHSLSDASKIGYGQASYLRLTDENGRIHCSFVAGKAKVTPQKTVSIPRLELAAATVSVRVAEMLKDELDYEDVDNFYWTDSEVVFGFINNESKRFHVYVANRVQLIRDHTAPEKWKHVATAANSADEASRGTTAKAFLEKSKYVRKLKERVRNGSSTPSPISVNDLKNAEVVIIKWMQHDAYSEEIELLQQIQVTNGLKDREFAKKKKAMTKATCSIYRLDPFLDQDVILKVGERLNRANLSKDIKHPIILPKKCHLTILIIRYFHAKVQHSGRGITLNELRTNGYWVVNGNAAVRSVLAKCVTCRYLRGSVGEQKMANLPESRLEPAPPFTYCAVDYFGPLLIGQGRKEVKRYGSLFMCLASRAVHIEVSDSLDTDSFLQALRRFISRRGPVQEIRSDQGTNFVGAGQ
ncbi:uncharacterized protein LOC114526541 [Dendronephthya gigantea]|uniref:uncharacterized protein LOC114526541 n=1 Tax=Dendronephthya gigantea TaxID=151771 RepID=UPI00106D0365|nr:uncharacterized protein LOC114526541 [Dendronephthya gigantea]